MKSMKRATIVADGASLVFAGACAKKKPAPVTQPAPRRRFQRRRRQPDGVAGADPAARRGIGPGARDQRGHDRQPLARGSESDSPFRPAFFGLDSSELDDAGRAIVSGNADIMKKYPTWVVTVEGHCDERGTAEYNLALGELRAVAVKTYWWRWAFRPTGCAP